MYPDCRLGELIRRIRLDQGMSQEVLSDGICDRSQLSKIENGGQVPRASTFRRLLERLGEPGFFHEYYYGREHLDMLDIQCRLIECYEAGDLSGFTDSLLDYRQGMDSKDCHCRQFIRLMEVLYSTMLGEKSFHHRVFEEVLRITHTTYREDMDLSGFVFDYTEFLALNNMAIAYIQEEDFDRAGRLYSNLIHRMNKTRHFLPSYWKIKGGVYNNLAVCELFRGNGKGAMLSCQKALEFGVKNGGLLFFMKLLRTSIMVKTQGQRAWDQLPEHYVICLEYSMLPGEIKRNIKLEDFMNDSCVIRVF